MNHVFISYSRRDEAFVRSLTEALAAAGVQTWLDQRSLPVSLPWLDEIRDAIEESVLFVVCDSANYRSSTPCAAEREFCQQTGKSETLVRVGDPIASCVEAVERELRLISRAVVERTELRVRARNWSRAGRPSAQLVPWRQARVLRKAMDALEDPEPLSVAFLAASRRRSLRRSTIATLGAATVTLSVLLLLAFPKAQQDIDDKAAEFAAAQRRVAGLRNLARTEPYAALAEVATYGDNEGFVDGAGLLAALEALVPDDAFTVEGDQLRFVGGLQRDWVTVADASGSVWRRKADDADARAADELEADEAATALADEASDSTVVDALEIILHQDSGVVELWRDGKLVRRITSPGPALDAAASPDGLWLAVAVEDVVVVYDIGSGRERVQLRGAPSVPSDLTWSVSSDRLWAVAGATVVSWKVVDARTILHDGSAWFISIVPGADGSVWLVDRMGTIRRVTLDDGSELQRIELPHDVYAAAFRDDVVYLVGLDQDLLVDLGSGAVTPVPAVQCVTSSIALVDATRLLVACRRGPLQVVALPSGEVLREIEIDDGARSVAIADDGSVHVGSEGGAIVQADLDTGATRPEQSLLCRSAVQAIELGDEGRVLPLGIGSGNFGCSTVLRPSGWGSWGHDVAGVLETRAGAFVAGGDAFVVAHADGSIFLHPTENLTPVVRLHGVAGPPRDVLVTSTGEVLVATRNGLLVSFAPPEMPTNAQQALVARARLDRAIELGLADVTARQESGTSV